MQLKNKRIVNNLPMPSFFFGKTSVIFDGDLNKNELNIFLKVLYDIDREIENDRPNNELLSLNVYFLENDSIELSFENGIILGCYTQSIFFPCRRWREYNLPNWAIRFAITEELCHAVWQIPDGPILERKIEQVYARNREKIKYSEMIIKLERLFT